MTSVAADRPAALPGPPDFGEPITLQHGRLQVPAQPIIPFIEGDGTGPDIWRASQLVFDAAVEHAYGGARRVAWYEVLAGEKSKALLDDWLPDDTLSAISKHLVVSGPLIATRWCWMARSVSSGSQLSKRSLDFSPAKTSNHWIRRLPP